MNDAHIAAIISAVSGITGVILGNSFVAIKESLKDRKKDERDLNYLAILVVSHLDRFVNSCWYVAKDDGTIEGRPAGGNGEYWKATASAPEFKPLEIDVEWKVLPKELMYDILQISDKRDYLQSRLASIWEYDDGPEYSDYFSTRQSEYAQLGLHVSAVARRLREHSGMPIGVPDAGGWVREAALQKVIDQVEAQRMENAKRAAETWAALDAASQQ